MSPESGNGGEERARALRADAQRSPESVSIEQLTDALVSREQSTRRIASEAMGSLLQRRSGVADEAFAHLVSHLRDDDTGTRLRATLTARDLAAEAPAAVQSALEPLRTIATDPAEPGREPALLSLAEFAIERPGEASGVTEPLLGVTADTVPRGATGTPLGPGQVEDPERRDRVAPERTRRDQVRVHAIAGVAQISTERPDVVEPHRDALYELLEDEHHLVRAGACEAFVGVGQETPEAVEPAVPDLVDLVANDTQHPVPWRAGEALVVACDSDPAVVGRELATAPERLRAFLDSRDPQRRRTGLALAEAVANADAAAATPLRQSIRELLDEDDPDVRATAARTLGAMGGTAPSPELVELAASDLDPDVRAAAGHAIRQFERSITRG